MFKLRKTVKKSHAIKFVYQDHGQSIAWAYLYLIFQDRHKEPYGYLENVYVEKEYRGQGLGKKLVSLVIQEAKKRKCYKLIGTSRMSKPDVHKFYDRLGFRKYGFEFRMDLIKSKPLQRD